jgi:hypothetical protein
MSQYGEKLDGAHVYYHVPTHKSSTNTTSTSSVSNIPLLQQYGESLNASEPDKDMLYGLFDTYFNQPTMTKIKDVGGYSVYMSKTYCLLSKECRYIVVFVPIDSYPKNTQTSLSKMRWISLQTRTLPDNHKLPPHNYQPRRFGPLNVPIERVNSDTESTTYMCSELPITITLLNDKNSSVEYQAKGNVISAIETYNTIITFSE